jgi:hypothetical protein
VVAVIVVAVIVVAVIVVAAMMPAASAAMMPAASAVMAARARTGKKRACERKCSKERDDEFLVVHDTPDFPFPDARPSCVHIRQGKSAARI